MGLLDSGAIRDLFGSVFGEVYEDGRLIRRTMIRTQTGSLIPGYLQPLNIKVQVDRLDETMRSQQGYTQRAQKDYTDQDVKLLVLQAGVNAQPDSDDIVQTADGRRWNMKEVGEDPARSYWRGRGVRVASTTGLEGWLLEFGMWDDAGRWRDDAPWSAPTAPVFGEIESWQSVGQVMNLLGGLLSEIGEVAASWSELRTVLNIALASESLDVIAPDAPGSAVRYSVNELVEALS